MFKMKIMNSFYEIDVLSEPIKLYLDNTLKNLLLLYGCSHIVCNKYVN